MKVKLNDRLPQIRETEGEQRQAGRRAASEAQTTKSATARAGHDAGGRGRTRADAGAQTTRKARAGEAERGLAGVAGRSLC